MSKLNIEEWTADDVADWMSGLEPVVVRYIPQLKEKGVHGRKLLTLRCDDLEYLGIHVIGHQELFLEAVEQLRHFHYESRRECIQQLAMKVSVLANSLTRSLRARQDSRLDTQALADIARLVSAVKPLVSWIDSWNIWWETGWGAEGRGAILRLALEAATAATRERFAEQPARAACRAARALHVRARALAQEVVDWRLIQPASVEMSSLRLDHPAHTVVQMDGRVVLGWRDCDTALVRRGVWLRRAPPAPRPQPQPIVEKLSPLVAVRSDDDTYQAPIHTRMFPPKPRGFLRRRHTIAGDRIMRMRSTLHHKQFWQELNSQKWAEGGGSGDIPTEGEDDPLYRRDKALSCSTGLELSPRPTTCLGLNHPSVRQLKNKLEDDPKARGKLDKSHSTPAYDFNTCTDEQPSLVTQVIPESPTTPNDSPTILVHSAEKADQILDFKKSSTQIEEAIQQQQSKRVSNGDEKSKFSFDLEDPDDSLKIDKVLETINIAIVEHQKENKQKVTPDAGHTKTFSINEHIKTIQNEMIQAITRSKVDVPPEPPPRPISTQRPIIKEPSYPKQAVLKDLKDMPTLKPVKHHEPVERFSPLKPLRNIDASQISLPLKHITKHDIQMISSERRELPPLNSESLNKSQTDLSQSLSPQKSESTKSLTLSPTASVVRGMFPSSKSKNIRKKNSILARGRDIPAREATRRGLLAGWLHVRAPLSVWHPRYLVLTQSALLVYTHPQSVRACTLVGVAGACVSVAREVRSRPHCFKLYRSVHALYCAAPAPHVLSAWLAALTPLTHAQGDVDESLQFSETSCSEDESDEHRLKDKVREREIEREKEKEKEKDKSKFGSLKKLTNRMHRSDSQEAVSGGSSLDRKYLRFFTRHKNDNKNKCKTIATPVPTEHYRSYRRVQQPDLSVSPTSIDKDSDTLDLPSSPTNENNSKKIPKPINYIHASNPNLVDFEKSDFVTKPNLQVPKSKTIKPDNFIGFVTLEEFMLKKQEEERQQVYTNRVLMGIERDKKDLANSKKAAKELQKQLDKIVPDVIYGELPTYPEDQLPVPVVEQIQSRTLPKTPERIREALEKDKKTIPEGAIPISIKGKDGYEKIVYTIGDKSPKSLKEPPKVLPRRPLPKTATDIKPPPRSENTYLTDSIANREMKQEPTTPEFGRKSSLTAKDLGYELIYDEKPTESQSLTDRTVQPTDSAVNLAYEKFFEESGQKGPALSSRRFSDGRLVGPPRIMPKSAHVLSRQSSLTSSTATPGSVTSSTMTPGSVTSSTMTPGSVTSSTMTPGSVTSSTMTPDAIPQSSMTPRGGVDTSPVFVQGESPEKFWLNSLRRNDKVHEGRAGASAIPRPVAKSAEAEAAVTVTVAAVAAPGSSIGATSIGATSIGATSIGATSIGATSIGATSIGATSIGATSIGATSIGATSIGATSIGATSIGATSIGATSIGATSIGATSTNSSRRRHVFAPQIDHAQHAIRYAHLTCPPTFEPESYSLQPPRRS